MLAGKKTYLAAGGVVLGSIAAWLHGDMAPAQAVMTGLQGLAMMFLRNAIPDQPSSLK